MAPRPLTARFQLQHESGARVGEARIRLLDAIGREGSISAGARAVGLSYRGAWDAVQALNALFGRPVVQAQVGGRDGGLASVTPLGRALVVAFQRIDAELDHVATELARHMADETEPLERLIWRLGMKTSARNTLHGVVTAVTEGAVNSEVDVRLDGGAQLVAVVTRASVETLGLAPGRETMALVKASFVLIAPGDAPIRISARNRLPGTVTTHAIGAVSDEVVLALDGGGEIVATITRESGEELGLKVGDRAQALIKASHVILAVD